MFQLLKLSGAGQHGSPERLEAPGGRNRKFGGAAVAVSDRPPGSLDTGEKGGVPHSAQEFPQQSGQPPGCSNILGAGTRAGTNRSLHQLPLHELSCSAWVELVAS